MVRFHRGAETAGGLSNPRGEPRRGPPGGSGRPRNQPWHRSHGPQRRRGHGRYAPARQPLVPPRGDSPGGQRCAGRLPQPARPQRGLGRRVAIVLGRAAVRRPGRLAAGALYPRYFGYYDRAVTVYTHTSDQHSVYGTRAIPCSPRRVPVRAGRPAGERHDPAASGALDRHPRRHGARLRAVLPAGLHLPATAAKSGRPDALQGRPGGVLRPPGAALPRSGRHRVDPGAMGPSGPDRLVAAATDRSGTRGRATPGQQLAFGPRGQGPDGAGAGRENDLDPPLPPRGGVAASRPAPAEPWRVAAPTGALAVLRQPGGVSHRRLRGDHEQGELPEPAVERGAGVEHGADGRDRGTAASGGGIGLNRGPGADLPAGLRPRDPEWDLRVRPLSAEGQHCANTLP